MNAEPSLEYVSHIEDRIGWYNGAAKRNMMFYSGLRILLVLIGATLPFVAAQKEPEWATIAGLMGVIVAAVTGLEGFFRPGEKWQNFRATQIALMHEMRKFRHAIIAMPEKERVLGAETYRRAFDDFFTSTGNIMGAESERFWQIAVKDSAPERGG